MINWNASDEDWKLAVAIAVRVEREIPRYPDPRRVVMMDIIGCHANGCPLDLTALLAAPSLDFSHDLYGIRKHIDRTSGELVGCFVPRYAKPALAQVGAAQ